MVVVKDDNLFMLKCILENLYELYLDLHLLFTIFNQSMAQ